MRHDDGKYQEKTHVVFDFTGVEQANLGNLALILTARLHTNPDDLVWGRSIPLRTARILRYLNLEHLFPEVPVDDGPPN
jgi:hypothetical protein